MKILVKIGGSLLESSTGRESIARQLSALAAKHELVVVHGGGKQLTRYLDDHKIVSRFVNGLRVSDREIVDAAVKVIAGTVNKQLVAALVGAGRRALGLSGIDGALTVVKQASPELELVGSPVRSDGALLRLLIEAGFLPVVACVAADERGDLYNVNADRMAASCAVAFAADELIFLTDVEGVRDAQGTRVEQLDLHRMQDLTETGVVHGGMQAKLEAAAEALAGGVPEIVIAPGYEGEICARLLAGENLGTRVHVALSRAREVAL